MGNNVARHVWGKAVVKRWKRYSFLTDFPSNSKGDSKEVYTKSHSLDSIVGLGYTLWALFAGPF